MLLCPEPEPTHLHTGRPRSLYGQPDDRYSEMARVSVHNKKNTMPSLKPLSDVYKTTGYIQLCRHIIMQNNILQNLHQCIKPERTTFYNNINIEIYGNKKQDKLLHERCYI